MKMYPDHDPTVIAPNQPRAPRAAGAGTLLLILAVSMGGVTGCGQKTGESSPPAPSTPPAQQSLAPGATSPIQLNIGPRDSCVTFVPHTTTIHVGDRVNFNTNSAATVTVYVPAGLFSAHDTSFTVNRGANDTSPAALATGAYPITSSPKACASVAGGGGPSIIVDSGASQTKP